MKSERQKVGKNANMQEKREAAKHTENMFVYLRDLFQTIAKSILQIADDGAVLLALSFKPEFGGFQSFPAFS